MPKGQEGTWLPELLFVPEQSLALYDTCQPLSLARIVYRMLKFGEGYVEKGMEHYEAKYRHDQIKRVAKTAAALNLQLTPLAGVVD